MKDDAIAMGNTDAQKLIERYMEGTATPQERLQVEAALNRHMANSDVRRTPEEMAKSTRRSKEAVLAAIELPARSRGLRYRALPYVAAAALLIVGLVFWRIGDGKKDRPDMQTERQTRVDPQQVLPGGNRATLTLADGSTYALDEQQTGVVIGPDAIKYGDGSALLDKEGGDAELTSAVLTTPKGGAYQVTLPDGTKVWLNAASTLKYPTKFTDTERVVELQGEAYFDVTKQQAKGGGPMAGAAVPFKVKTKDQVVEVLGTGFNISAYAEDVETKTTLVEGRVNIVTNGGAGTLLLPGEQATLRRSKVDVRKVDVEQFTAWKDGFFYFDNLSPQIALAQLARWYDVEVLYQGAIPEKRIFGMIDRGKSLGSVLKSLEKSGLTFRLTEANGHKKLLVQGER